MLKKIIIYKNIDIVYFYIFVKIKLIYISNIKQVIVIYTVDEVAERLSVSKVTIYAKLKKFDDKVVLKQGKKYITDELFNIIKNDIKNKGNLNTNLNSKGYKNDTEPEVAIDRDDLVNLNDRVIKTLIEQLDIKDKQIEEKDKQIKELHELLEQSQKLVENNQVLLRQEKGSNILKLEEHFQDVDDKLVQVRNELDEKKQRNKKFMFWNRDK